MAFVTVNGLRFHYVTGGNPQGPWVTLSNSIATDLELWRDQLPALAERFRVLRYDQRGHGRTDVPPRPASFEELAADVAGLWDALGIESSAFVGISMGGITGLALAAANPKRIARLVVCDAFVRSPPGFTAAWDQRIALALERGMEALAEPTLERWFHPDFLARKEASVARIRHMILATPPRGFVACAHALREFDFTGVLDRLLPPLLFVAGAQDGEIPKHLAEAAKRVPGVRSTVLEPAGHLANVEQPEAFTRAVLDFLVARELQGARASSEARPLHRSANNGERT